MSLAGRTEPAAVPRFLVSRSDTVDYHVVYLTYSCRLGQRKTNGGPYSCKKQFFHLNPSHR